MESVSTKTTADAMARHCPELTPCSTAELEHQASHQHDPPVTFVNGFQKRLGVLYMTDSRETDMTSDSESDISSLEIDSNLSHSSELSNTDSPKCTFLPQNDDEHLEEGFSTANTNSHRVGKSDGVEAKQHNTPLPDESQSDNSFRQNNLDLKNISRDDDLLLPLSVNKPRVAPISQRSSVTTTSPTKTSNSIPKDKPLVIKIRRRTWTVSEDSQCHRSIQNGDVIKKARINSTCSTQQEIKSAFELSSSSNYNHRTLDEWHSIGDCLPVEKPEKFFPPKQDNDKKVLGASKTKHRQRHKSKKLKGELTPHRKKKTSRQHHHKTKRKKSRENASESQSKSSNTTHPGKTLRLPTDPQKAVKVLERALESINAQIKQLKEETGHGNRPRSHRGLRSKKTSKKRLHKETKRHNSTKIEKKPGLLPVAMSFFKLNDSFSVVPSLIVRDGDLHPAYSASVDPGEPPVTNHPIWRWRIGQAPLPKPSSAPADQVIDWLDNCDRTSLKMVERKLEKTAR